MIAEIGAGLGSLKAAKDIVQALNGMQTAAAINDVKLTLQGHILEAQQALFMAQEAQSAAASRVAELEQEIVRMKDWSSERHDYELVDTGSGGFAYMQTVNMRAGEPPHWLCASCFEGGKKSILQNQGSKKDDQQHTIYACPSCKGSMVTHWRAKPQRKGQEG